MSSAIEALTDRLLHLQEEVIRLNDELDKWERLTGMTEDLIEKTFTQINELENAIKILENANAKCEDQKT